MSNVELDTFLITLTVPKDKPVAAIRRILDRPSFHNRLRRAIKTVLKQYRPLKPLAVSLSR
jgi:hypothetical protein